VAPGLASANASASRVTCQKSAYVFDATRNQQ
jgi:hypothetical protein